VKAIPVSVRERILHFYNEGRKTKDIASLFGYCPAAIRRVRQRFKQRGTLEPQTHRCGRKSLLTDARKKRLLAALDKRPDATLAELGAQFKRPASTIDLWLARLGWSCKKNALRRRAVQARRRAGQATVASTLGGGSRQPPGVSG
jgi:transposase